MKSQQNLQYVSMLDDFARSIDAKDVHPGIIMVARPVLETMQNHKVFLGDCAFHLHAFARPIQRHALEVADEAIRTCRDMGLCWMYSLPA